MNNSHSGLRDALIAFGLWGSFGLFFHFLSDIPSTEVLINRVIWCLTFVALILLLKGQFGQAFDRLCNLRTFPWLFISGSTITLNWGLYIWLVSQHRITEASLGYYLAPLINLAVGTLFLKEKIDRIQVIALILAATGVIYQIAIYGQVPWFSLLVAGLMTIYNLIRKQIRIEPLNGLFIESLLVSPFAIIGLLWLTEHGENHFQHAPMLLIFSGILTSIPLLFFASAARKLSLSLIGFLSYISPSIQFITAVIFLGEPFNMTLAISFGLIWIALLLVSSDLILESLHHRRNKQLAHR